MKRGHPLMLGSLDEKVKNFLMILRRKGGVGNSVVAIAVAQVVIEKSTDDRRMHTIGKLEIRDQAVMEAKLLFRHHTASLVEEHNISPSFIMNFDKSPLKYAPVSNSTLTKKRMKTCPYHWWHLQIIDHGYLWHRLFK